MQPAAAEIERHAAHDLREGATADAAVGFEHEHRAMRGEEPSRGGDAGGAGADDADVDRAHAAAYRAVRTSTGMPSAFSCGSTLARSPITTHASCDASSEAAVAAARSARVSAW